MRKVSQVLNLKRKCSSAPLRISMFLISYQITSRPLLYPQVSRGSQTPPSSPPQGQPGDQGWGCFSASLVYAHNLLHYLRDGLPQKLWCRWRGDGFTGRKEVTSGGLVHLPHRPRMSSFVGSRILATDPVFYCLKDLLRGLRPTFCHLQKRNLD